MASPGQAAEFQGSISEELRLLREETVSIAARHEQPISEAPSNVYVITDEDIRQSGATDLPTVLRRIPGIEVMQVTGADFNVSARGDNQLLANKVLVMVDGRSIYVDPQGNVFWKLIPVTLPEIKRIEVLKGPASALYGFNAFDGVVNIITKSPEEMKGTMLQFGGGEFGTITSAAIHAGVQGKFGYRLSVGRDQNNQWRNRDALAFRDHKFNVHTEYSLSRESRLQLSGGLVDANRFDGPFVEIGATSATPAQAYTSVAYERPNFFIRSFWTGFYDTGTVMVQPSLANLLRLTDRSGNPINKVRGNTYDIELQHAAHLGDANRLTYGLNYRHSAFSSSFMDDLSREDRLGFYLQNEWQTTQTLSVVAGLRYDLHTEISGTVSPRLALVYKAAPDHTVRAAISLAYRPPTLSESHLFDLVFVTLPPPIPSPPAIVSRGTGNLSPEQIISYEAGYQGWFFKHRLRLRGDVFFNHISDLVSFPTASTSTFVNDTGQADIYGGEVGIEFLATKWLSGFANYAYEEIGQSFTETTRRGAPRFKFNAGLRAEWENGLSTEVALHHVGAVIYPISNSFFSFAPFGVIAPDIRVGSYNLLNLRAGYRFWKEKAEVAVSVFNALNDRHKEHPLGDTIGSRVMGWLTMKF